MKSHAQFRVSNPITAPLLTPPPPPSTHRRRTVDAVEWGQIADDLARTLTQLSASNPFRVQIERMIPQARENAARVRAGQPTVRLRMTYQGHTIESGDDWEPGANG